MKKITQIILLSTLALLTVACANNNKVVESVPQSDKLPKGPGILSGDDGAFKIEL